MSYFCDLRGIFWKDSIGHFLLPPVVDLEWALSHKSRNINLIISGSINFWGVFTGFFNDYWRFSSAVIQLFQSSANQLIF